jgi:pimeloyl-ACP methyl ester carboxylesterase
MATYVLIHGAGDDSSHWERLVPELERRGHDTVAPDLPCDDDHAGFAQYAQTVVDAIGDRTDLLVVAQSLAGFTAPLVATRVPVRLLVFLNAMVPRIGEAPGDYWDNTGWENARREAAAREGRSLGDDFDPVTEFLNDVPADVVAATMARPMRTQSSTPFEQPYPLTAWPAVPVRSLLARDDRFFPADYQRRIARERLGVTADEMPGGHCPALGHPEELAARLEAYRAATFTTA